MSDESTDVLIHRHFEGTLSPDEESRLLRLLREDPAAGDRLVEFSELESGLAETLSTARDLGREMAGVGARASRRRRTRVVRRSSPALLFGVAAAAVAFFALLFLAVSRPAPKPRAAEAPEPIAREIERPVVPPTPRPPTAPLPAPAPEPPRERPAPAPQPPMQAPAPSPEPKPPSTPPPPPRPPEKTAPVAPRLVAVALAEVRGGLYRQGSATELLASGAKVDPGDTLLTLARRDAQGLTDAGFAFAAQRGASLRIERRDDGAVRVLLRGVAFFEVPRRDASLAIVTSHGEAHVQGTAFQVDADDRRAIVHVVEGSVRLRNDKGEALVRAGQRSSVRAAERPAAAVKADVEGPTAWRRRLSIAANPERTPYVDHEIGGNRRLAGVVVAAPFFEGEANAGALARAVAERSDTGLVLGHHYRDLEKRIWVHLDRGLEAPVGPDGAIGTTAASDRARNATADYLAQARAAAGASPVPMMVQFRDHNLAQGADELEVGEVAWSGWNRKVIVDLRSLYAALLDRHRPKYRLELRFQGIDDAYEFKGQKRSFSFAEADARDDGYMSARNSRNALAVFLNPGFLSRGGDVETYSKIFVEMIEFLHARRR